MEELEEIVERDGNSDPTSKTIMSLQEVGSLITDDRWKSDTVKLLISRPLQKSIYRSYNLNFQPIRNKVIDTISNLVNPTITEEWTFSESSGGGLSVTYPITNYETDDFLVLNTEYVKRKFNEKVDALSAEIYEKKHIQSYVGQIIFSTTIRTEAKLKKYYGNETQWRPIEGRFLMTTKQKGWLRKTTGDFETPLTINDVPPHSHEVTPQDNSKTTRLNWTITPSSTSLVKKGEKSNGTDALGVGPPYMVAVDYKMHDAVEWTGETKREGWAEECKATVYGRSEDHGVGGATVTVFEGQAQPHNNIPPFFTLFAWERVK